MRLDPSPVVGLPHRPGALDPSEGALDCRGATLWAFKAAGRPMDPADLCAQAGGWEPVSRATQALDVAVTGDLGDPHVLVLIDPRNREWLTSTRGRGVRVLSEAGLQAYARHSTLEFWRRRP